MGAAQQMMMAQKQAAGGGSASTAQYRGTSSVTFSASGTAPSPITGHAIGDLMYCHMQCASAITADANWTTLSNIQDGNTGNYQYIAWRKATTSDGLTNDRCLPTYTGSSMGLYIFSFSGVDSTAHEQYGLTQWAGSAAIVFPPSATPTLADSVHIVGYSEASGPQNVTTPPAGYTQIVLNSAGGSRVALYYKKLSGQAGVAQGPINMEWAAAAYGPAWTAVAR